MRIGQSPGYEPPDERPEPRRRGMSDEERDRLYDEAVDRQLVEGQAEADAHPPTR